MNENQENSTETEAPSPAEDQPPPPKNKEVVILKQPEPVGWFHAMTLRLWAYLFGFACTLANVLTVQTIWNWHAPKYLGMQPVNFGAVFLLIFLLKTVVLGRVWQQIRLTKRVLYLYCGVYNDTSVRENVEFLWMNAAALGAAWLLKHYGSVL